MYHDPKDKSVVECQGVILRFKTGERCVVRVSGTGASRGATLRVYLERVEPHPERQGSPSDAALAPVVRAALAASRIRELTGRESPTVVT